MVSTVRGQAGERQIPFLLWWVVAGALTISSIADLSFLMTAGRPVTVVGALVVSVELVAILLIAVCASPMRRGNRTARAALLVVGPAIVAVLVVSIGPLIQATRLPLGPGEQFVLIDVVTLGVIAVVVLTILVGIATWLTVRPARKRLVDPERRGPEGPRYTVTACLVILLLAASILHHAPSSTADPRLVAHSVQSQFDGEQLKDFADVLECAKSLAEYAPVIGALSVGTLVSAPAAFLLVLFIVSVAPTCVEPMVGMAQRADVLVRCLGRYGVEVCLGLRGDAPPVYSQPGVVLPPQLVPSPVVPLPAPGLPLDPGPVIPTTQPVPPVSPPVARDQLEGRYPFVKQIVDCAGLEVPGESCADRMNETENAVATISQCAGGTCLYTNRTGFSFSISSSDGTVWRGSDAVPAGNEFECYGAVRPTTFSATMTVVSWSTNDRGRTAQTIRFSEEVTAPAESSDCPAARLRYVGTGQRQ